MPEKRPESPATWTVQGKQVPVVMQTPSADGGHRITIPLAQVLSEGSLSGAISSGVAAAAARAGNTGTGPGDVGDRKEETCHWSISLEPCTLCFPFTDWCWEDKCLSIEFKCSGSF